MGMVGVLGVGARPRTTDIKSENTEPVYTYIIYMYSKTAKLEIQKKEIRACELWGDE